MIDYPTLSRLCASLVSERHPADPGSVEQNARSVQVCECGFYSSVSRSDAPAGCSAVCIHNGIGSVWWCVHVIIVHELPVVSSLMCAGECV